MKTKDSKDSKEDDNSSSLSSVSSFVLNAFVYLFWITWSLLAFSVIFYLVVSGLMLYSTEFKMELIFANRVRTPFFANLSDCNSFGIIKCENFYMDGHAGKLGAWFISPSSKQYIDREAYILYLHGNSASRALDHRVALYKRLSKMGYHILAFDYRGFGDSEGWPTELGLLEDSKKAYRLLMEKAHGHAVYVWGHSLGSAVGVQLASWLNSEKARLNGVILEAPFNNMTDGIKYNVVAKPLFYFLPQLEEYIQDMQNVFRSSYWIQKVTSPILILHDVSDHIINIGLGRRLYASAKSVGSTNVQMHEFDKKLYHNNIHKAVNLKKILSDFIFHTS